MAQGIKHGMLSMPLSGMGNAIENDGAACTAGKELLPILSLAMKPNMPFT